MSLFKNDTITTCRYFIVRLKLAGGQRVFSIQSREIEIKILNPHLEIQYGNQLTHASKLVVSTGKSRVFDDELQCLI